MAVACLILLARLIVVAKPCFLVRKVPWQLSLGLKLCSASIAVLSQLCCVLQSVASLANLDLNGNANGASNGTAAGTGTGQAELDVHRTVTGVLSSRPTSRDIKIDGFSMGVNGSELIQDCTIELTIGRRYGLLGQNGCGKTNFLQCLAHREVPIPDHMDLYHLCEEAAPTDRTALETVVDYIKDEVNRLTVRAASQLQD